LVDVSRVEARIQRLEELIERLDEVRQAGEDAIRYGSHLSWPTQAPGTFIAIIAITMAQLLVRDIEGEVVRELKVRAARHGRSAEEEHRQILREALRPVGPAQSLKELLLEMPDVGEDRDFERPEDRGRAVEL